VENLLNEARALCLIRGPGGPAAASDIDILGFGTGGLAGDGKPVGSECPGGSGRTFTARGNGCLFGSVRRVGVTGETGGTVSLPPELMRSVVLFKSAAPRSWVPGASDDVVRLVRGIISKVESFCWAPGLWPAMAIRLANRTRYLNSQTNNLIHQSVHKASCIGASPTL